MTKIPCVYCMNDHTYVCDCGHAHDRHTLSGGCKYEFCKCERYSQLHQRLPEETEKQYQERILGKVKKIKAKRASA